MSSWLLSVSLTKHELQEVQKLLMQLAAVQKDMAGMKGSNPDQSIVAPLGTLEVYKNDVLCWQQGLSATVMQHYQSKQSSLSDLHATMLHMSLCKFGVMTHLHIVELTVASLLVQKASQMQLRCRSRLNRGQHQTEQ